jgi:aldehyde:ferredoxin oxidoreductase
MLGCISPDTGGFSSGSFGWIFPSVLKYAGYDIVIARGKAPKPTYVFIDDNDITFRDASHLWGKETGETVKMIREEIGERYEGEVRVLSISIAGENLVRYAPPCADGTSCPGRSGGGTVMGSKNLKAIAVRGTGVVNLHDPRGLLDSSYRIGKTVVETEPLMDLWREHGATTSLFTAYNLPLNGSSLIENRQLANTPHLKNVGCLNCMAPCYHWLQIQDGEYTGLRQLGGHMTFITNCIRDLGIMDFGEWIYYERLMQELGLDPSSFTLTFSWAVDCFDRGYITEEDTDGLVLKRGDAQLIFDIADRVAHRKGAFGNLLADGIDEARKKVGKGSADIAPTVKGKPYLQGDPRVQALIWSLSVMVSPRGGDWNRSHNTYELAYIPERRDTYPKFIGMSSAEAYRRALEKLDMPLDLKKQIFGDPPKVDSAWIRQTEGKAAFTAYSEDSMAAINSLVTCMYSGGMHWFLIGTGPTMWSEVLNKITGWNTTPEEIMKVGERVFNLQRLFNYRLKGWTSKDDVWADKRIYEKAEIGTFRGREVPWNETLQEYYAYRGWNKEGVPTRTKALELKLDGIADELKLTD